MAYTRASQSLGACCSSCANGGSCLGETSALTAGASQLAVGVGILAVLYIALRKKRSR